MSKENQELWKAVMEWLEIAKETDNRLLEVRRELEQIKQTQR